MKLMQYPRRPVGMTLAAIALSVAIAASPRALAEPGTSAGGAIVSNPAAVRPIPARIAPIAQPTAAVATETDATVDTGVRPIASLSPHAPEAAQYAALSPATSSPGPRTDALIAGNSNAPANRNAPQLSRPAAMSASTAAVNESQPSGPVVMQADVDPTQSISLGEGKGTLVRLNADATSVFVADPAIADVHVPSPRVILVLAKKTGATTLYALGAGNKTLLQRNVVVQRDMAALQSMMQARFPKVSIRLTEGTGSLYVTGEAPNASEADAIVQSLTPYLADKEMLVNHMTISRPQQVQLRVRITEVDRNVTQQWGINWQAMASGFGHFATGIFSGTPLYNLSSPIANSTGGTTYPVNIPSNGAYGIFGGFNTAHTSIEAMIDALNQEGLLTILAEPNLVAESGQTASFLAGGEFPIPVSQINGAISVEFKQFGVKLDFTPTVVDDHHISIKVRPEVSQIDTTTTVTTNGITIPGLSVRRADTTVDLSSGQSFAIGGLLQTNTTDVVQQVPGIGSIPVIGKLFSSTNYLNNKTELVIIVTPYLVEPVSPAKLHTPLESLRRTLFPSGDIEYGFERQQELSNPSYVPPADPNSLPRLIGGAGYVY